VTIKVGGYGAISFNAAVDPEEFVGNLKWQYYIEFFHGFMHYIKEKDSPLDFLSWHSYGIPTRATRVARWAREQLDRYGFKNAESHLNEWNPRFRERGTEHHSALVTAMMLGMQKAPVDLLVFYDARLGGSPYGALFDPYTYKPWHTYYSLVAFDHLYKLGDEVYTDCDTDGIYVAAASDGKSSAMVISNISDNAAELNISGADLSRARYHVIDQQRLLSWSPKITKINKNQVVLIEF